MDPLTLAFELHNTDLSAVLFEVSRTSWGEPEHRAVYCALHLQMMSAYRDSGDTAEALRTLFATSRDQMHCLRIFKPTCERCHVCISLERVLATAHPKPEENGNG